MKEERREEKRADRWKIEDVKGPLRGTSEGQNSL
jgi:hypothetical protein